MNHREQSQQFQVELNRLIDRFRAEYDLSLAQAIGVLEVVKLDLWRIEAEEVNKDE